MNMDIRLANRGESYRIFAPRDTKYLQSLNKPPKYYCDVGLNNSETSTDILYGNGDRINQGNNDQGFTNEDDYFHDESVNNARLDLNSMRRATPSVNSTFAFTNSANTLNYEDGEMQRVLDEVASVRLQMVRMVNEITDLKDQVSRLKTEVDVLKNDPVKPEKSSNGSCGAKASNETIKKKEAIVKQENNEANKVVIHIKKDDFTPEEVVADMERRCPHILDYMERHITYDKSRTMIFIFSSAKTAQEASNRLQANLRDLAHANGTSPILKSVGVSKPLVIRELRQWAQRVKERHPNLPIVVYAEMPVLGKVFSDGRKLLHNIRLDWAVHGSPTEDSVVIFLSPGIVFAKEVRLLASEGWINKLKSLNQWPDFTSNQTSNDSN